MQPASAAVPGRERPRFRQDLIAELIEASGARFIDVVAPEGGDVFRFYEVEYSLACGMDGERDIAGIVRWAQDELGLSPSQQEVRAVVATLGDLGFIEGQAEAAAAEAASAAAASEPAPDVVEPSRPAPPAAPSGIDLGAAGPGAPRGGGMPPAPEVASGGPGGQRITRPTPAPVPEVASGAGARGASGGQRITRPTPAPPPPSEVSIDLADHIEVGPDDVKEAVRASKVMSAVEAPPDMHDVIDAIDAIHDRPTGPSPAVEPAFSLPQVSRPEVRLPEVSRPEVTRQSEATRQSESAWLPERSPDSDSRFDPRPESRIGKPAPSRPPATSRPPVELPPPVISDKMPTSTVRTPPPQRPGSSPFLVAVFFLVILAAGGYFVWKYVLNKGTTATTASAPAPQVVKPPPPPPAPPPPPPTAKIALETPPAAEVTLSRAGQIETILADKTPVKESDVILRLVGDKPIEAELGGLGRDQKRMQDAIDALTRRRDTAHTAGNKAAEAAATAEITERQKTLTLKQNALAAKTAELDNFLIRAPTGGTFSPVVKPGAKIAADTVVARIQREAVPTAMFKIGNTRAIAANASVELAIGKGEQRVTCTIADVQPEGVKVTCPVDPALTDGTDVTLNTPASTAPEAPAPNPAPPPAGSAEPPPPSGTGSETAPAPSGTTPAEGGSAAAGSSQPDQPAKTP